MKMRAYVCIAAIGCLYALAYTARPLLAKSPAAVHLCGVPAPAGALAEPPDIDVSQLPLNDVGRREIILAVAKDGERFCYRYALNGTMQNVAPILRVHRGETFALRLVNELGGPASGETLRASVLPACKPQMMPMMEPVRHFVGYMNHTIDARHMPIAANDVNMHFHGFQGPASEENVFLSTLSTPAHACEYVVTIPKTQPPGTYVYHPHAHGAAAIEVAGGLGGMWIVEPDTPQIPRADDHPVVIGYRVPFIGNYNFLPDDTPLFVAALRHTMALKPAMPVQLDPFNPPPWPSVVPAHVGEKRMTSPCGDREGAADAVNGMDTPARITVPAGVPQLFRVLNATSDSAYMLNLRDAAGGERGIDVVGRDGTPVGSDMAHPLASYETMQSMQLVPFARIDMLLTLKPGEVLTLGSAAECLAPLDEIHVPQRLLTIAAGPSGADPPAPQSQRITPAQTPAAQLVAYARAHRGQVRRRAITYSEYLLPNANGKGAHSEYYITETSNPNFHEQPFWPEYAAGAVFPRANIHVKRGTIEEWYLYNTTEEPHTFHIHQMNFVAEDATGGPATLDTILVPFGKLLPNKQNPDYPLIRPSVTRVLLDFRNVPRGTFVFHCHMLFHEDRGMMALVTVD